jgi:hypothetical protein
VTTTALCNYPFKIKSFFFGWISRHGSGDLYDIIICVLGTGTEDPPPPPPQKKKKNYMGWLAPKLVTNFIIIIF